MNKAQLIDALTDRLGNKKAAGDAVEAFLDTVTRAVTKGERVAITGFGVFERVERRARTGRNPATGATVKVKKKSVPRFKPGQGFKDIVSGTKKLPKAAASKAAAGTSAVKGATGRSASKSTGGSATKSTGRSTAKSAAKSTSGRGTSGTAAAKRSATGTAKSAAKRGSKKTATAGASKRTTGRTSAASKSTASKTSGGRKTATGRTAKKS